jgi:hypothetical protein
MFFSAAAEVDARRKEAECARLREEELRRLAAVEVRALSCWCMRPGLSF